MARNVNRRLEGLKNRRSGADRLSRLNDAARIEVIAKSVVGEKWQQRAGGQPNTRYALGAMQEVGAEYTNKCLETATRVGQQLETELTRLGFSVGFELQGSVPLNVHIRGVSDVDLLTLDVNFRTYDRAGIWSLAGVYQHHTSRTSVEVLADLRRQAEQILKDKYPAATVDTSGSKAISIYGGSLARPVDVVPSHWHDTIAYQQSSAKHARAVTILDKKVPTTIDNLPFLHIKKIAEACDLTGGALRKAIRLAKNVKADAIEDGSQIDLPSFDIAALMYHADWGALAAGGVYELAILAEVQRHFDALYRNREATLKLRTPDGLRYIIDNEAKWQGLLRLSVELDDLLREVAKEQNTLLKVFEQPALDLSRSAVTKVLVPA